MSATKRYLEQLEEERCRKEKALLEVPAQLQANDLLIRELHADLLSSSEEIGELRAKLLEANSFRTKCKDYLTGGIVGAVFGLIGSFLART